MSLRSAQTNMTELSDDSSQRAYRREDETTQRHEMTEQDEFLATLFEDVAPEDVARYDRAELVAFATAAWMFVAKRVPGEPKIRLTSETYREGDRRNAISILEIVNDDMPFLLSSVLAELAERKITVQLVAHPVLNVTRDETGHLIAFSPRTLLQRRESFIHLHIDRIEEDAERNVVVASLAEVDVEMLNLPTR